jgi:hypothetical protein
MVCIVYSNGIRSSNVTQKKKKKIKVEKIMKSITEIKKELKAMKKEYGAKQVTRISVTVIESDIDEGYDYNEVCLNVWMVDKWGNSDFQDFVSYESESLAMAEQVAKMHVANLNKTGYKTTYGGVENC